ncbi:MAG: YkgJ family cysteine cluster protein [Gammaproteobacteria bacterium]|nr:YkgJ family cysteine cluster protein [Gammaproteobacteria bacterium]
MQCREGCGACCIAPSISSPIPGMPAGKPAGVRCVQLDPQNYCLVFGQTQRPAICISYAASHEFCGENKQQALHRLQQLEQLTTCHIE